VERGVVEAATSGSSWSSTLPAGGPARSLAGVVQGLQVVNHHHGALLEQRPLHREPGVEPNSALLGLPEGELGRVVAFVSDTAKAVEILERLGLSTKGAEARAPGGLAAWARRPT
jgi:hypothetical protein